MSLLCLPGPPNSVLPCFTLPPNTHVHTDPAGWNQWLLPCSPAHLCQHIMQQKPKRNRTRTHGGVPLSSVECSSSPPTLPVRSGNATTYSKQSESSEMALPQHSPSPSRLLWTPMCAYITSIWQMYLARRIWFTNRIVHCSLTTLIHHLVAFQVTTDRTSWSRYKSSAMMPTDLHDSSEHAKTCIIAAFLCTQLYRHHSAHPVLCEQTKDLRSWCRKRKDALDKGGDGRSVFTAGFQVPAWYDTKFSDSQEIWELRL
jgi:hypothetical protein